MIRLDVFYLLSYYREKVARINTCKNTKHESQKKCRKLNNQCICTKEKIHNYIKYKNGRTPFIKFGVCQQARKLERVSCKQTNCGTANEQL